MKSKAFRARLSDMQLHELENLQRYAQRTCAFSTMLVSDRGSAVLVCLKDQARSAASFSRTVRSALRKMGMPTTNLRGHWLHLITEQEALAICQLGFESAASPATATTKSAQETHADTDVNGTKTIHIR